MHQCNCPEKHSSQPQPKVVPTPIQHQVIDGAKVAQLAKNIQLKDDPIDWNLVYYFVMGTIIYYAACGPVAYFFSLDIFPQSDTGNKNIILILFRI